MSTLHPLGLIWFTDLDAAIAEATRSRRPILSLRLLGRLDDELSCANSRFFKKLLYPDPQIHHMLRRDFVLHWQSLRPVPRVTIDFGDGRVVERTLTGNSCHVVLDPRGRAVDVIPGLMAPSTFADELVRSRELALADRDQLRALHERAMFPFDIPGAGDTQPRSRAMAASAMAATKHRVEAPLLRAMTTDLDADTAINLELHGRIHQAFAAGIGDNHTDAIVAWVYADLFLMPLDDMALGLDVADPFSAPRSGPGEPRSHRA